MTTHPGAQLKPYRVEWQADLTMRFVPVKSDGHDDHDEALEAAKNHLRRYGGRVRVISQHVIAVKGLGSYDSLGEA